MDLQLALKWFELQEIGNLDLLTLKKKYRKLTIKYHPDKGGKTADFVKLQAAYNFLQEYIKYPHSHKTTQNQNSQESSDSHYSQSDDSNDIDFYKQQLNESQKVNAKYEDLFNFQIITIKQFYNSLDQLNTQNDEYNDNLEKLLDRELANLDKKYKSDWWKSIVGIKSMSKNDYIYCQNQLIGEYNQLLSKSQKHNQDVNFEQYKRIINQIVQGINTKL